MTLRTIIHSTATGLTALAMAAIGGATTSAMEPSERVPIIVELFTSEGCSSCPPADSLLSWLSQTQPFPDVLIIPLSQHVDYWDQLGWRDRFSSPQFTERQQAYASAFDLPNVYTPQMVIDGRAAVVGSLKEEVTAEIRRAYAEPKIPMNLEATRHSNRHELQVRIQVKRTTEPSAIASDVWLAITENALVTDVMAGENMFRRLRHTGVVHHLERLIDIVHNSDGHNIINGQVRLSPTWKNNQLRVVAFLQDRNSQRVVGAAQTTVD